MDLPPSQVKYYPAPPPPKRNTVWWILGGVVVLLLACCVVGAAIGGLYYFKYANIAPGIAEIIENNPVISPSISEIPINPPGQSEIAPPVVTELVSTLPPPTITPTLEPTPNVSVNGINFSFAPAVAQNVTAETVPAAPPTQPEGFPGEVYPQHNKFSFNGYPLSGTFHSPYILVYPAKEYADMDPSAATVINDLTQFLAQKPTDPERIPFLPLWNAGQMFHSNMAYLSFKNGSGVRFLTMYGQAYYPVNNNSLFYSFQGLTNDGAYYIAAVLPVTHPDLPGNENEIPGGNFDAFVANIATYMTETAAHLEAQSPNTFTPDLTLLDAMFESIAINP